MSSTVDQRNSVDTWKQYIASQEVIEDGANPELVILGGPSCVGKSTALKLFRKDGILREDAVVITPDLIRSLYPELQSGKFSRHPEKSPEHVAQYTKYRDDLVVFCMERNLSVVLDDHCDDVASISSLLNKVRTASPKAESALLGLVMGRDAYIQRLGVNGLYSGEEFDASMSAAQKFFVGFSEVLPLFDVSVIIENDGPKPISPAILLRGYSQDGTFITTEIDERVYERCQTIAGSDKVSKAEVFRPADQQRGMVAGGAEELGKEGRGQERFRIVEGSSYWAELAMRSSGPKENIP